MRLPRSRLSLFVYLNEEKPRVVVGTVCCPRGFSTLQLIALGAQTPNLRPWSLLVLTAIRLEDARQPPNLDPIAFASLSSRKGDPSLSIPSKLPVRLAKAAQPRYTESSIYPYLETNVDSVPMSFSQEPILSERSKISIAKHGEDTPFRHHSVIRRYVESLVNRNGYNNLVCYNTTVELAEKVASEWRLVLRRSLETDSEDEWWEERFDAVVVASGHYSVPYIPKIEGLEAFERAQPGSVKHSKMFRGRDEFKGKVSVCASHLLGCKLTIM
jgi:hypothetical protein